MVWYYMIAICDSVASERNVRVMLEISGCRLEKFGMPLTCTPSEHYSGPHIFIPSCKHPTTADALTMM